jgi:hypothetical protein
MMKNRRNYYRILHVQPDAPAAIIKASYRALMQKLRMHPDLGGDDWNAAVLNEAYATLSNPEQRAAYDRELRGSANRPGSGTRQAGAAAPRREKPAPKAAGSRQDDSSCPFCQTPHPPNFHYLNPADCRGCGAPLQAANHPGPAGSIPRAIQRRSHSGPLQVFTSPEDPAGYPCHTRDLSPAGLQFASPTPLTPNQIIRIDSKVLSATIRVTHCLKDSGHSGYIVGGAFLTLRFHENRGTFVSENA